MNKDTEFNYKPQILIVDDSEMNRNILSEMLGNEYHIVEAENGAQAVAILQKNSTEIALVLLDIVMPVMDGYDVLKVMNSKHWIDDTPVIMISAENSYSYIEHAYELGVTDYISRPFDVFIVRQRVVNTIMLYSRQRRLASMVAEQIYEKEKNSNLMVNILSHIVEFRNGESGLHVVHVQSYTRILLRYLVRITDKYNLYESDITLISHAAALHDIGKISIPDEILNKPGKLTSEEFEIMKGHSMAGANMIGEITGCNDEPLIKVAYEICRWHHERYDGRGYPDGLKGDEIPISAQIVALADVYDALTSDRVYKKAYSHETAVNMILNGECGTFNPLIIKCLKNAAQDMVLESKRDNISGRDITEPDSVPGEMLNNDEISRMKRILCRLDNEQKKNRFFTAVSNEVLFEYISDPSMLLISPKGTELMGLPEVILNPFDNEEFGAMVKSSELKGLKEKLHNTTPRFPLAMDELSVTYGGKEQKIRILCKSTWSIDEPPCYTGVIGKIVDSFDSVLIQNYLSNIRKENDLT